MPCRKCGTYTADPTMMLSMGKMVPQGPSDTYEPAYEPSWWKRLWGIVPHRARMRRGCKQCKAVYYELPWDESDALAVAGYGDVLIEKAMRVK